MKKVNFIEVSEWDALVEKTYGRPYSFQQQDGCKERGIRRLRVPATPNDFENDTLPEVVNHEEMGVSFSAWLTRDPKEPLKGDPKSPYKRDTEPRTDQWAINMWWERNFYPHVQIVANDLFSKGLLEEGEFIINIDW